MSKTQTTNKKAKTQNKKIEQAETILVNPDESKSNSGNSNENQNPCDKYSFWNMLATIFMALSTSATVLVGIYMVKISNGQLETQRFDQRPWVAPFPFGFGKNAMGQPIFQITYKNSGKTPAYETIIYAEITEDINRANLAIQKDKTDPGAVLFPNGIEFKYLTKPFAYRFDEMIKQNIQLYVWGTIWYKDGLGNPHETDFCYAIINGGIDLVPHGNHNTAN